MPRLQIDARFAIVIDASHVDAATTYAMPRRRSRRDALYGACTLFTLLCAATLIRHYASTPL